jgi:hypothetical protein
MLDVVWPNIELIPEASTAPPAPASARAAVPGPPVNPGGDDNMSCQAGRKG